MPKPNKQHIIDAIIKEIEQGKGRGYVLGKIGKKWGISRTTFDRLWKTAQDTARDRQERASKAADAVYIQMKENAAKEAVMSKQERLEYLTKIVKGEIEVPYTEVKWNSSTKKFVTVPFVELSGHSARIAAIAEINKMSGDYAPTKVANTDVEGNSIVPFTDSQVDKIIKALETEAS